MPAFVGTGVGSLLGVDTGEDWRERLQEASYTSPSGTRVRFDFVRLSRTVTKRGTVFEFAGIDGGYVQRKGYGPRRYPMRCYFSGPDHDRIANAFVAALVEDGVGELAHPMYGTFKAVPLGDITEREDLVNEANQSVIEVTFWTTLLQIYPAGQSNPESEIEAALAGFDVVAAQEFADATSLASAANRQGLKGTVRGFLNDVRGALQQASDATASARRDFDDNFRLVNEGIDVLVGQPLLLAQRVRNLTRAPSRALAGITSRLEGYGRLAERIFGSSAGSPGQTMVVTRRERLQNDFQAANLFAMQATAGSVASVVNNTFKTKPEALEAVDVLLDQFEELVEWREGGFEAVDQVDTGGAHQALHSAISYAAGFLVQVSFNLVPERRLVLGRARSPITVCAEVYGDVDNRLPFFISSNNLTGSEILELPAGRAVVYYPDA